MRFPRQNLNKEKEVKNGGGIISEKMLKNVPWFQKADP